MWHPVSIIANVLFVAVMAAVVALCVWLVRSYGLAGAVGFTLGVLALHVIWRLRFGYWAGGQDTLDLD